MVTLELPALEVKTVTVTFVNHESFECHEKTVRTVIHTARVAQSEMNLYPAGKMMMLK